MKRLILFLLLLTIIPPVKAATWYATSSSANFASVTWRGTQGASCAGSGTTLTYGSRGANDTFNLNGCTAVAIAADPSPTPTTLTGTITLTNGSTTLSGSGTSFTTQTAANDWIYISGQPPVQVSSVTNDTAIVLAAAYTGATTSGATGFDGIVTIETDGTNGGGATYATATNITVHAVWIGAHAIALTTTGSSGGGTFIGAFTGTTASGPAVTDSHTVVTINYIGNMTGGSASSVYAVRANGSGTFTFIGDSTAGSGGTGGGPSPGLEYSGGTVSMTGRCIGNDAANSVGCYLSSGGAFTLTGSLINGKVGPAYSGGTIYFTPGATNYILSPKDSSYTLGTINSHATLTALCPANANIQTGTACGPNTGTLNTVSSTGNW